LEPSWTWRPFDHYYDPNLYAHDGSSWNGSRTFRYHACCLIWGIGLVTPPVGAVLFVGCAIGKIPIEQTVRTIWPFYGALLLALIAVIYIPGLSLWLPSMLN
jgi:sorbitol-specific phosphotransferase system component IIBC